MTTIQMLGDVAEIVSAIAVVVTLAFLVVQVRDSKRVISENSRLIRAAAVDKNFEHMSRWRDRIIESAEVADIWVRGAAGEELSPLDRARFVELVRDVYLARSFSYTRLLAVGSDEGAAAQVRLLARLCREHPGLRQVIEGPSELQMVPVYAPLLRELQQPASEAPLRS